MDVLENSSGGYDSGYRACRCFWGPDPGSLVRRFVSDCTNLSGLHVLDVGCGEGKNAVFLAQRGAVVHAMDVSPWAIENAQRNFGSVPNVTWAVADVREVELLPDAYDLVVAYGVFHCLRDFDDVRRVVNRLQRCTRMNGHHIVCSFNNRDQDLEQAHPGFRPCLLSHASYVDLYCDWNPLFISDSDLIETHPHNNIEHRHSMTRLIARRT